MRTYNQSVRHAAALKAAASKREKLEAAHAAGKCPTCHRALTRPQKVARLAATGTVSLERPTLVTDGLSDADLFAQLKKIAVREDARFFLRYAPKIPAPVRREAEALLLELEVRASKPADAKRLHSIKDRARAARPWPKPWTTAMIDAQKQRYATERIALVAQPVEEAA